MSKEQLIAGNKDNNNLVGTNEDDYIQGLGGNDTLSGELGNDTLDGGEGTDTLDGGEGDDVLVDNLGNANGGEGDDTLGVDYSDYNSGIYNTDSNERFRRTSSNAILLDYGNIEQFEITGTSFNDTLKGGAGDDTIDGGAGNDNLSGLAGNDTIDGGAGNDSINSGAGNDSVTGVDPDAENAGVGEIDTLAGGADGDRFFLGNRDRAFYDDGNAIDAGTSDYALITDFDAAAGDTIQLYGLKSRNLSH